MNQHLDQLLNDLPDLTKEELLTINSILSSTDWTSFQLNRLHLILQVLVGRHTASKKKQPVT